MRGNNIQNFMKIPSSVAQTSQFGGHFHNKCMHRFTAKDALVVEKVEGLNTLFSFLSFLFD